MPHPVARNLRLLYANTSQRCISPRRIAWPHFSVQWIAHTSSQASAALLVAEKVASIPEPDQETQPDAGVNERQPSLTGPTEPQHNAGLSRRVYNAKFSKRVSRLVTGREEGKQRKRLKHLQVRPEYTDAEDWRECLRLLRARTPVGGTGSSKQTVYMRLSGDLDKRSATHLGRLFLNIQLLTECHAQRSPQDADGAQNILSLTGTAQACRRARILLERAFDDALAFEVGDSSSFGVDYPFVDIKPSERTNDRRPLSRAVWARDAEHVGTATVRHFTQIGPPRQWTIISFANYVDELVLSKPSRQLLRNAYGASRAESSLDQHRGQVTRTLVRLFRNPAMVECLSPYACATALTYLAKHRRFPEIRQIFQILDTLHTAKFWVLTAPVFNRLLSAAAAAQDLHNFRFVFDLMLMRRVRPTWETWAALVRIVQKGSQDDASRIIEEMRTRNLLLDPAARMALAEIMVGHDYQLWVKLGRGSAKDFFDYYDRMWHGPEWLTRESANRMLDANAARGQFSTADALLDELLRRGRDPDVVTLNSLLRACVDHGNTEAAILFAERLLSPATRIRPDKQTFHQLYRLAWLRRNLNLLRVVWRYACMHGHASWEMQTAMCRSILRYAPTDVALIRVLSAAERKSAGLTRTSVFESIAANVAAGLCASSGATAGTLPLLFTDQYLLKHGRDQASTQDAKDSPWQQIRRKRLLDIINADVRQFGTLEPRLPLAEMLRQAFTVDTQWKAEGLRSDLDIMVHRAVGVPVTRKDHAHSREVFAAS